MTSPPGEVELLAGFDAVAFAVGEVTSGHVGQELRDELEALTIPRLLLVADPDELEKDLAEQAELALRPVWAGLIPFKLGSAGAEFLRGHAELVPHLARVVQDVRFTELAEHDRPLARAMAFRCELVRHALIAARSGLPHEQIAGLLRELGLAGDADRIFATS